MDDYLKSIAFSEREIGGAWRREAPHRSRRCEAKKAVRRARGRSNILAAACERVPALRDLEPLSFADSFGLSAGGSVQTLATPFQNYPLRMSVIFPRFLQNIASLPSQSLCRKLWNQVCNEPHEIRFSGVQRRNGRNVKRQGP